MGESTAANPTELPRPPRGVRWTAMFFMSLAMFGNYYVYDSIAPVADLLKNQLGFNDEKIGQLYSIYSVAAVIVLLISGYVIDRAGTKVSTFVFAVLCLLGGILTAASADFRVMLAGRFVLGLGAESLIVAVTTALAKWFKGKELGLAFGVNLTIARLGSFASDWSPTWAKFSFDTWQGPLVVAAWIGAACVLGAGAYWFIEHRSERRYELGQAGAIDKLDFKDLFRFDKSYWYVVFLCLTFYSAIFPFRSFAIKFFIEAHGTSRELGGQLNSIIVFAAMIATPLFGLMTDKLGKRALFMAVGSVLLLPVYLMMAYQVVHLYVPVTMMGIAFSLIPAILWPSVAYLVEQHRLGSAYALMTLIQQIGFAIMNWLIGKTNDIYHAGPNNPAGYTPGMWIFSILGLVGLTFSYLLWRAESGPKAHGLETVKVGAE
ncbi:MAG: MFS transporter [Terriglobales bacterium]